MTWEVEFTDQFFEWWENLSAAQQEHIVAAVAMLEAEGPALGRPRVDTIAGSNHSHMKELRVSQNGAIRILFAFDPFRRAILLIGGDKTGRWSEWYKEFVPLADRLYDEYLEELRQEGRLP